MIYSLTMDPTDDAVLYAGSKRQDLQVAQWGWKLDVARRRPG